MQTGTDPVGAMNILVDFHHPGLYHSLQLLFEDRLGHCLFRPVGHDWWDAGYWRFGEAIAGDDRLAQRYLSPNVEPYFAGADPEFPERAILGVALQDARCTEWAAVIATVQENQPGFARFAKEHGAKYVYHVGNPGQRIDYSLRPYLILA